MGGVKSHAISIHSLHTEGDLLTGGEGKRIFSFQSTPSTRRETVRHVLVCAAGCDFNPLPPHGGRRPPAPLWGATEKFQSTPSVWRETVYGISGNVDLNISIHSLRMEGDDITFLHFDVQSISIHSLRMEGDVAESVHFDRRKTFQSTPSVWRETDRQAAAFFPIRYFNPLPPYGGRQSHQT